MNVGFVKFLMLFPVISKKKNSAPKIVNFRHKISLQHSNRNMKNLLVVEGCSIWMFSEVVFPKCFLKKTFLEISQISTTLLKIDSNTAIFLWKICEIFKNIFLWNTSIGCFCIFTWPIPKWIIHCWNSKSKLGLILFENALKSQNVRFWLIPLLCIVYYGLAPITRKF